MSSGLQFMTKALPILKVALEKRCISVRVTAAATMRCVVVTVCWYRPSAPRTAMHPISRLSALYPGDASEGFPANA